MKTFALLIFTSLVSFSTPAHADRISVNDEFMSVTCTDVIECLELCAGVTCPIAKLTCAGCARSSDPQLMVAFRSLPTVFEKASFEMAKKNIAIWAGQRHVIALGVDSPLNVFADPFDANETTKLQESFDRVCGSRGRHFVLAETGGATPGAHVRIRAMVCEDSHDDWTISPLKVRTEMVP